MLTWKQNKFIFISGRIINFGQTREKIDWWCLRTPVVRNLKCELQDLFLQIFQIVSESFPETVEPNGTWRKSFALRFLNKFSHFRFQPVCIGRQIFGNRIFKTFYNMCFQGGVFSINVLSPQRDSLSCQVFICQPLLFVKASFVNLMFEISKC